MPDYKLGKIYMVYPKVEDPDEGDVYYGSTVDTLARRMNGHRNKTQCKILFDKYGIKNCFIELVEEYPCETKEQLNRKEGEYIRDNKCINKIIAGRTYKEYYDENRNKIIEKQKEYRNDNTDKYIEYQKQYYVENRDKILEQRNQKASCPHCNKEMTKRYLPTHIKSGRCHIPPQLVHTTVPESN